MIKISIFSILLATIFSIAVGLVFGLTPKTKAAARWLARPAVWGILAIVIAIILVFVA